MKREKHFRLIKSIRERINLLILFSLFDISNKLWYNNDLLWGGKMSSDIIKTIDVKEFCLLGDFPSVLRNWEINKVKPVLNKINVVNKL